MIASTAPQHAFLKTLLAERVLTEALTTRVEAARTLAVRGMLSKQAASDLIGDLKVLPYREGRAAAEPGFYVQGERAFKVQANKAGTSTYALEWTGSSWEYAPGVGRTLADLTPMTAEQAALLGLASGHCIACCRSLGGKTLSAQVAAVVGYGEICADNHGWPFPKGAAAQRERLAAVSAS